VEATLHFDKPVPRRQSGRVEGMTNTSDHHMATPFDDHRELRHDEWEILESELDPAVAHLIRSSWELVVRGQLPTDLDVYELV
jgi:hypothetical protein